MQVHIIGKNNLQTVILPEQVRGQYTIRTVDERGVKVPVIRLNGDGQHWQLQKDDDVKIALASLQANEDYIVKQDALYVLEKPDDSTWLLFDQADSGYQTYTPFCTPYEGNITFGDSASSKIRIASPIAHSKQVFKIRYIEGSPVSVVCNPSDHCQQAPCDQLFLNGQAIRSFADLKPGDCLFYLGMKIIVGQGFLSINNPHGRVLCTLTKLRRQDFEISFPKEQNASQKKFFSSAPRAVNEIVPFNLEIKDPPSPAGGDSLPAIMMIGPSLTMATGSLVSSVLTVNNLLNTGVGISAAMPSLVATGFMMLGTVCWPILNRHIQAKYNQKKDYNSLQDYQEYINQVNFEAEKQLEQQTKTLIQNNPNLKDCINLIETSSENLWQRSPRHKDFLEISVGMGSRPMDIDLKYKDLGYSKNTSQAQELMMNLVERNWILENVPLTLNLKEAGIVGVIGQRQRINAFIKALLIELTALHNYEDLKIFFIYDESERSVWEFVKWIPHLWNDDGSIRFLANDSDEVRRLASFIESLQYRSKEELKNAPHYLIFAADKELAERAASIKSLYKHSEAENITLITMYNERQFLPKGTRYIINVLDPQTSEYNEMQEKSLQAYMVDLNDISGKRTEIQRLISYPDDPKELFIRMANIKLDSSGLNKRLPDQYTLMEMLRLGKVEHLDTIGNWNQANSVESLAAPIGIDSDGFLIYLDLHEKAHGPHGAIAGMTGSGKSEFVISYIISMALHYSPEDVAFVFIDFKGGGMADVFKDLPHTAGTITNLDGNELQRSFIAIENELAKRQKLFKKISEDKKISNIDIYKYHKLRKEDPNLQPLPHLILIADEFAELKQQQNDFMGQLIRIARIGRSLGVHLVLATQKPDGVVDPQIQSNIRFKVCLKVQEKSDSQSMIGRPDAAWLTRPGRFYLQVGNDEVFEYGQSPWSGALYEPVDQFIEDVPDFIEVLNEQGMVISRVNAPKGTRSTQLPEKQVDALVQYIAETAAQNHFKATPIWLNPIPVPVLMERNKDQYDTAIRPYILNPIIGEYDDLKNQRHPKLTVPFSEYGNTLLYGMTGSGKQEFLNTMILRIMEKHSAQEVNFWLVDADTGALMAFENSAYTQMAADLFEIDRIKEAIGELQDELTNRKQFFRYYGGDYQSYMRSGQPPLPCHMLVIHNYQNLEAADSSLRGPIIQLAREGFKYGIYMLISAVMPNAISYTMRPLFKNVYTLQQNTQDQYTEAIGRTQGMTPSRCKGRGLVRVGEQVCEFQTDLLFENEISPYTAASELAAKYESQWISKYENNRSEPEQTNDSEVLSVNNERKSAGSVAGKKVSDSDLEVSDIRPAKEDNQAENTDPPHSSLKFGTSDHTPPTQISRTVRPEDKRLRRRSKQAAGIRTPLKKLQQETNFLPPDALPAGVLPEDIGLSNIPVGRYGNGSLAQADLTSTSIFVVLSSDKDKSIVRRLYHRIRFASRDGIFHDCSAYSPKQMQELISVLKEEIKKRTKQIGAYNQQVLAGDSSAVEPAFSPIIIWMDHACELLDKLDSEGRTFVQYLTSKLTPKYRITFILSETEKKTELFTHSYYYQICLPAPGGLSMIEGPCNKEVFGLSSDHSEETGAFLVQKQRSDPITPL